MEQSPDWVFRHGESAKLSHWEAILDSDRPSENGEGNPIALRGVLRQELEARTDNSGKRTSD